MFTKLPRTPGKAPWSKHNGARCRPCSPSRWLRERYLSPSSSRITGREIFITTTHCGQLSGVTWKMSCKEERMGHVNGEGGGILFVLRVRLLYGLRVVPCTRRKDPDSPKSRISSRSVMIPRCPLARIGQKRCPSALMQTWKVRARTVHAHRLFAEDKGQCNLLSTATCFILNPLTHQLRHHQPWAEKGGDGSKRSRDIHTPSCCL